MSLIQEVLYTVSNYPGGYRIIYDLIYDSQKPSSYNNKERLENTLRVTLSRLKKKGLIQQTNKKWTISKEGKKFLDMKTNDIRDFFNNKKPIHQSKKRLIVAFDIPEKKKRYREWFRKELVEAGFEPVQKSIWLGPPLPKEFIEYLNGINLLKHIRFFNVSESDLI